MNKQELNAKWSKYCDVNKLVDDAIALLKHNGHECTEHGVCAMLDKYFKQKEPLIKMFMTSKNYIGNMRIAVEKEFDRTIDARGVRSFFIDLERRLYTSEMLKTTDDNGKTLFDNLVTGKKTLSISELPSKNAQDAKRKAVQSFDYSDYATHKSHQDREHLHDCFNFFYNYYYPVINGEYKPNTDITIPNGTKTSRAFNKICMHYGVDKLHPETKIVNGVEKTVYPYDKEFAKYSDLVSVGTRKMHFVISLNPLDYFTMSCGVNWTSCQHIYSGGAKGGAMSYILDKVSIITFVVENLNGDIHNIPKVYRQMFHYEKSLFVQNRLYPQGNDGATNLYDKFRGFMIEEFTDLLDTDNEWTHKVGANNCIHHIREGRNYMHYRDYIRNSCATIFYPTNNEPKVKDHVMTIGHEGICVKCGNPYYNSSRFNHRFSSDCEDDILF